MIDSAMIEVSNLTKSYAGHLAIDGLTFTVGRGEIVGLLGPNGAGKSTTMRILSCFLPATSGTARVAGFDVFTQSREVRRRIGYMPENNPLYLDMRVVEYLKFRARLKGLTSRRTRERVATVMDQCMIGDVSKKIIGQLSMGYRQRVGLADALVHEPELIILDEPTLGLDPNQIRAVRQLIKDLGGRHTVLLSTHILPEVEMTCNRVLILLAGKILAADTPQNLQAVISDGGQIVAEIAASVEDLAPFWRSFEEIESHDLAVVEGDFIRSSITPKVGVDIRNKIFERVKERGWAMRELTRTRPSLEDIFVHMTKPVKEEEEL